MTNSIKMIVLAVISTLIFSNVNAQTKWALDNSHTNVKFTVTHLVISEVEGYFKTFNGSMTATKPDFTDAQIDFTVDVASVNTDNEMRDNHLKSNDFFNAEKFPQMKFTSISFKKIKDKKYQLIGNLTIRDVTKKVIWDVVYGGTTTDPWGNVKAGFKATTTINRLEYGLKWNTMTEAGGAVVGPEVEIRINAEFAKQK